MEWYLLGNLYDFLKYRFEFRKVKVKDFKGNDYILSAVATLVRVVLSLSVSASAQACFADVDWISYSLLAKNVLFQRTNYLEKFMPVVIWSF